MKNMKLLFKVTEDKNGRKNYWINNKKVKKTEFDSLYNDESLQYEKEIPQIQSEVAAIPEEVYIEDCDENLYDKDIKTFVIQLQSMTPDDAYNLLQYELEITSALGYYAGERDALKSVRKSINEGIGNINDDESDFMINNGIDDD
jgi:hypothetical protein